MLKISSLCVAFLTVLTQATIVIGSETTGSIVSLSYAKFQGAVVGNVTQFLGMPYAQPPINDLRFRRPLPPKAIPGIQQAVSYGPACPQQTLSTIPIISFPNNYTAISEDCLYINVFRPAKAHDEKLPVAVWIFGGGFEIGDSSDEPVINLVERSIAIDEPVIVVSPNYRINGFGFLAGKEVQAEGIGNLGLRDQRFALEWVQEHIESFGGDPTKVMIFGLSAGAISTGLHMVSNEGNTNNLFRAAFMMSGGPISTSTICDGQDQYDFIVAATNCTDAPDTLACLRQAPFDELMAAINNTPDIFSYLSLNLTWRPRSDGDFLQLDPVESIVRGLYAKVPMVTGDADDEGTGFSLSTLNITTDEEFLDYIQSNYLTGTSSSQLQQVGEAYPSDPTQGSPFNTGNNNTLTPQFKRLAALQGDFIFQAPRRLFLQAASKTQSAWSYLYKRGKSTPVLGAFHGSDQTEWFYEDSSSSDTVGIDYLIHFINTLDPNVPAVRSDSAPSGSTGLFWPQWANSSALLTFSDPTVINITSDTYRGEAIGLLNQLSKELVNSPQYTSYLT